MNHNIFRSVASTTTLVATLVALPLFGAGRAMADSEPDHVFSANVALTGVTNYMFRGVSQTNNGPAVQGGFDYEYSPWGLYAGVWASNVDSSSGSSIYVDVNNRNMIVPAGAPNAEEIVLEPAGYDGASMELDLYAGWVPNWQAMGINGLDALTVDIGYLRYQYPGTDTNDNNTNEWYIGLSYDVFGYVTPSYTANYSEDFFGLDAAWYHNFGVEVPLPYDLTLHGHYGLTRYNNSPNNGGGDSYDDYSAGLAYSYGGFDFDLSWISRNKTDLCSAPFQCGDTAVFTLSKAF
jgi:uncharacterized protein (TIGR02001 family)